MEQLIKLIIFLEQLTVIQLRNYSVRSISFKVPCGHSYSQVDRLTFVLKVALFMST
jgi:hypothetical protein